MKKVFNSIFIILICLFVMHIIYEVNTTQTVLLVGKVIGFEIEIYNENKEEGDLVPTSSKKLGTMTFIKKDTYEFAALGHSAIQDNKETGIKGICHEINIDNIDKSTENHIGHISGTVKSEKQIGIVSENNEFGIFGTIDNVEENKYQEIRTASRYEIILGDADLLISLEGEEIQKYNIEILEVDYLSNNKNIRIKIKDDDLISKTGGIVQGMSGAPIVQNGRLIGAINYADRKNPEEAYAIFIDKLI